MPAYLSILARFPQKLPGATDLGAPFGEEGRLRAGTESNSFILLPFRSQKDALKRPMFKEWLQQFLYFPTPLTLKEDAPKGLL